MEYRADGASLAYEVMGRSDAGPQAGPERQVVLLHPTPVDHHFWIPVAEELAQDFRILLPDLRGHGASTLGLEGGEPVLTMTRLAEDVLALLDAEGVKRAHFAGCSVGAYVLYALWKLAPDRVRSLAFCCGKPHADTEAARKKRAETMAGVNQAGTGALIESTLQTLVGSAARRSPLKLQQLRAMMERMSPAAVVAVQRGLAARLDARAIAAGITVPCLVVAAEEDPASTPDEMKELSELLPRNEFHLLDGVGHFAPFERPDRFAPLLTRLFLEAA